MTRIAKSFIVYLGLPSIFGTRFNPTLATVDDQFLLAQANPMPQTTQDHACLSGRLDGIFSSVSSALVFLHLSLLFYRQTLANKALAHHMGPDFLEQDVVMSKDGELMVLHDVFLEDVSDVAEKFPLKQDPDGHFYTWDFTVAEMKTLQITERFITDPASGLRKQAFPNRFPMFKSYFRISTLQEEIDLIQGLNKVFGKNVGIYPEIKRAGEHRFRGLDITNKLLDTLKENGYDSKESACWLQCFDPLELQRAQKLMKEKDMALKTVQLMCYTEDKEVHHYDEKEKVWKNYSYDWMYKDDDAMEKVKEWADAIGPWKRMLVDEEQKPPTPSGLVCRAHRANLRVHAYTFRADFLPDYAKTLDVELNVMFNQVYVDGLFTDFPDRGVAYVSELMRADVDRVFPLGKTVAYIPAPTVLNHEPSVASKEASSEGD